MIVSKLRCDMCGRFEGKTKFNHEPISLCVKGKIGRKLNLFLNVQVEDAEDSKMIEDFEKNLTPQLLQSYLQRGEDPMALVVGKIKNMHPCICNQCKREMIKLLVSYGTEDGKIKNIDDVMK